MLPLAGIELLALVVGLYCACWKMNFRQLIQIAPHKLSLTDGHYHPRRRWELDIGGRRSRPPQDSARLTLHDRQHRITLGAFLNKEDSEILLKTPVDSGLRMRSNDIAQQLPFQHSF